MVVLESLWNKHDDTVMEDRGKDSGLGGFKLMVTPFLLCLLLSGQAY